MYLYEIAREELGELSDAVPYVLIQTACDTWISQPKCVEIGPQLLEPWCCCTCWSPLWIKHREIDIGWLARDDRQGCQVVVWVA
eukprot:5810251-Heterocapsa_arctica.AAC.1